MDRKQPDEAVPLRGEQCRPEGLNAENSPDGLQATGWGCPPKRRAVPSGESERGELSGWTVSNRMGLSP